MNKKDAKIIAKFITNQQLVDMFEAAKNGVEDWTKVSTCNKGFTKGVAWNILAKDFDITHQYHNLAKYNMVHEFGDFLPPEMKPAKPLKMKQKPPTHQDPQF